MLVARRHSRQRLGLGVAEVRVHLFLGGRVPTDGPGHHEAAAARGRAVRERSLFPDEGVGGAGRVVAVAHPARVHLLAGPDFKIAADFLLVI